jgi:hypothetical protein
MILGLPRSGTTWAANWTNTETTFCIHDPLDMYLLDEIDNLHCDKMLGIACTGSYLFYDWLNQHPAKKVILHRDVEDIKTSLRKQKIRLSVFKPDLLDRIEGLHVPWTHLFDKPEVIWSHLFDTQLDKQRHSFLKTVNVQTDLSRVIRKTEVLNFYLKEIYGRNENSEVRREG